MIAQASCMKAVLRLQQYKGDPKKPSVLTQLKRQRLNLRKPWQLEFVEQRTRERRCKEICREVPMGMAYICTCMWGNYPKPGKIYKERVNSNSQISHWVGNILCPHQSGKTQPNTWGHWEESSNRYWLSKKT